MPQKELVEVYSETKDEKPRYTKSYKFRAIENKFQTRKQI